ncbi:DNA-directed RNA polymerase I protein [Medicago truncatula]|uniref:DNA-directed RNA polymerase subunit n=1 Tax=Medicago truncatula TaxID=3880 RepID=G7JSL1_MEDTR|nr:DNA-directed RNA polymerase I protein [Medicago truncatula]
MNMSKTNGIIFTKDPYIEKAEPRKIAGISYSTLSDKDITKIGEAQVWQDRYYDAFKKAVEGGVLDPRLGPANKSSPSCATCHGNFTDCQGHYGYLPLAQPVFNVGFLSTIVKILKCICKNCARILLDKDHIKREKYFEKMNNPKLDGLQKMAVFDDIMKNFKSAKKECPRCGYINGSVKQQRATLSILHDCSKANNDDVAELQSALPHINNYRACNDLTSRTLYPAVVLELFKKMHGKDCTLLYIAEKPENLIITNIAVPPIVIRPSVMMDGQSNENDITEKLKKIIQANAIMQQESVETQKYQDAYLMLQFEVAQYINSDVKGGPYNLQMSKPLTGFIQRIKGKQGRFRSNLSGKRVEYTGRTVISPDPNLKITEVAIPIHMARILTYPERVTHHNIEKLRQCVRNGPDKYPGARMVKEAGGNSWNLKILTRTRRADELKFGDIVERHIEDGDVVLFNRQPSLHRMSMMCHRARVMPWRTLRFNESVCNPYNADFDGDEMNIHVPQTEEARTEALLLMTVQNNLCTPKNGEILVASTQDFLTSSFLITRKDTFYDRSTFSLICSYMGDGMDPVDLPTPAIIKPVELWSGKQLFNILLRPHANVRVYVTLTVMEKNYGSKLDDREREFKTMCPDDGFVYFRNSELISGQLGKVTLGNGNKDGLFSVLLRDYKSYAAASCMNRLAKLSARWIGNHGFSIGIDDVQPKDKLIKGKEKTIEDGYKKCDGYIEDFNKGELKLAPGCDAAQTLESKIFSTLNGLRDTTAKVCMETLHWRNSPLIMSQCGSKGSPINICQMVACVGQQSVGGCRATNGFIDRNLPHFPKKANTPDAKGFVKDSFFTGLSATEFFFHTMGGREGLVDTAVKTADTGYMSRRLMKALEDLFLHYDYTVRDANCSLVQFCYGDDGMDPAGMEGKNGKPLNFDRLFLRSKAICPADGDDTILSSSDVHKVLHEKLSEVGMSKLVEKNASNNDITPAVGFSTDFLKSLQSFVGENTKLTESITEDDSNNLKNLKNFISRISGISRRQLEAGTPIGAIGAQSIGEPGTQMTLKTFHFAGVASMNVTLGVPRIQEIIDGARNIKTPIITAILEREDNAETARAVKGRIEKTNLGQVAKSIKVVYSYTLAAVFISLDMGIIEKAGLNIDANIVKESILQTGKLKLKPENIKILDIKKLQVEPPGFNPNEILFQLNNLKNLLPSVVVKGVKTVERTVLKIKKNKTDNGKESETYTLLAEGLGLKEVMGIEGVDGHKTVTNHIIEMRNVLGIEAARYGIIDQIQYTMKQHGMSIDVRHIMLLADMMTVRGQVLGMTRHGIQKMGRSALMLASFESSTDYLFDASLRGKGDPIEGVSDCIIMGKPIQIGTGMIEVKQRLDPPVLPQGARPILSRV